MDTNRGVGILVRVLVVIAGVCFLGGVVLASNQGGRATDVAAFPRPGTATALADGQLAFRGVGADEVDSLIVVGERSGVHEGTVLEHADGDGASFVPAQPFEAGETVRVRTQFDVRGGGSDYEITVASPPPPPPEDDDGGGDDEEEEEPVEPQSFLSAPDLKPPFLDVEVDETGSGDDPLMFSIGRFSRVPTGIYVMDDTGDPVWVRHTDEAIQHPHVIELDGEPVLTWWEGTAHRGWGEGVWRTVGQDYEPRAELAPVGIPADFHEVLVSERGGAETAIFLSYVPLEWDLSGAGGPSPASVLETVVQEVEIDSGAVVFEWHSLDHVGVGESTVPTDEFELDHFHGNSIEIDDDGDLIVSARNTSTAYRIDRHDGDVEWRLGGSQSDFRFDGQTGPFEFQHDVRRLGDGTISVFDNGTADTREFSRVLVLDVDETTGAASTVEVHEHDPPVFGEFTGNARWDDDGNLFVSWGSSGAFSEYGPDGELVLDGTIRGETVYRMIRAPWTGHPTDDPALVLRGAGVGAQYFVSWNGSTEVDRWRLEAGDQMLDEVDRTGFETTGDFPATCAMGPITAVALDAAGDELGASDPVTIPGC